MSLRQDKNSGFYDKISEITSDLLKALKVSEKKDFSKANEHFNNLINKLTKPPAKISNDKLEAIFKPLLAYIAEENIQVLNLVFNPRILNGLDTVDEEMTAAEQIKNKAFQKKGLVVTQHLRAALDKNPGNLLLRSLLTRMTFIFHWSMNYGQFVVDMIPTAPISSNAGDNLMSHLTPILADSKQCPRLERLTLLGCGSGIEGLVPSMGLSLTDDVKKVTAETPPAYVAVLTKDEQKNIISTLYFLDEDNIVTKLKEIKVEAVKEQKYLSKVMQTLNQPSPIEYENDSYAKKTPKLTTEIHKVIYEHSRYSVSVNGEQNLYFAKLLKDKEAKKYLKGESGPAEKKQIKKLIPNFGGRLFDLSKNEVEKNNLALKVEDQINKDRTPKIQIKAYSHVVKPTGLSITPQDEYTKSKTIIYYRSK